LGADPAGTAFVANATAGVTIALRSVGLGRGDEVLTSSHGYGSVALAVDHVASATARVMPVARIAALGRARDVAVLVDGAHAPGAHGTPIEQIGADFWVGNLHKWLYAPRPTGLLVVAARWRDRIEPPVISWHDAEGFPGSLENAGTLDYTSWLAAPTGLFVMRTLGVDRVRAHNTRL